MLKRILKIIFVFVLGIGGGIFADQILWPYFIERPLFFKYRLDQAPVYVTENNQITVQENVALQSAVEKVKNAVVALSVKTKSGKQIKGSGLVITSDGLVATLAELVPQGAEFSLFLDSKPVDFRVLKRDLNKNLALIKVEEKSLTTAAFSAPDKIKLGERVFLLAKVVAGGSEQDIVNEGVIRSLDENYIQTTIMEKTEIEGSPLFNIEGEVLGLNFVDSDAKFSAVSVKIIREFAGI